MVAWASTALPGIQGDPALQLSQGEQAQVVAIYCVGAAIVPVFAGTCCEPPVKLNELNIKLI